MDAWPLSHPPDGHEPELANSTVEVGVKPGSLYLLEVDDCVVTMYRMDIAGRDTYCPLGHKWVGAAKADIDNREAASGRHSGSNHCAAGSAMSRRIDSAGSK